MILLVVLCFAGYAQNKPAEKDTTIFFYMSLELNNGMFVVTPTDSVSIPKADYKGQVLSLSTMNRRRVLMYAQNQLGDKKLRDRTGRNANVMEIKPTLAGINSALNNFIDLNKGSVYNLTEYKFVKPKTKEKIKVTFYEE